MSIVSDDLDIVKPIDLVFPSLKIGAFAGGIGFIVGGLIGTLRGRHAGVKSVATGLQYGTLGSTFWATRSAMLHWDGLKNWHQTTQGRPPKPRQDLDPTPQDRVRASGYAGMLSATCTGLILGSPQSIIPGMVIWGLFGYVGQKGYNYLDARNTAAVQHETEHPNEGRENVLQRMAKSKYTPFTVLSDEDYENMLQEKLLKLEAEVALIDDRIQQFKKEAEERSRER